MEDRKENGMKPITEEIWRKTGGTFTGPMCISSAMAWDPEYDRYGRPTRPDPNMFISKMDIEGKEYIIRKDGFKVDITYVGDDGFEHSYDTLDITPDYIKEMKNEGGPKDFTEASIRDTLDSIRKQLDILEDMMYDSLKVSKDAVNVVLNK